MRLVDVLEHDPMFANSPYTQHMREIEQRGKKEGRAEGLVEGIGKGRAEGLVEGIGKGRAEGLVEGIGKGRAEGTLRTLRMSIVEIVRLRFPDVPGIVERLDAHLATVTDEARLRELFAAAVQAESSATVSNLFNGSHN